MNEIGCTGDLQTGTLPSHRRQFALRLSAPSYDADNNETNDGASAYGHDNLGRLTGAGNSAYGWATSFDALGRSTLENNSYGGTLYSAYDAAGDRTRLTYQDGLYIAYDYDVTGTMLDIRENGATSGAGVLASYGFDTLGRVSSVTYGSGVGSAGFSYDSAERLGAYSYTFGGDASKTLVAGLNYNPASQVRTRTFSNSAYEWSTTANTLNNYTVNGLNQITATSSSTLSYNARGSLANDGTNTYGYSIYNQLTSVGGRPARRWPTMRCSG